MTALLTQLRWAVLGAVLLACVGVAAALYGNDRHSLAAQAHALEKAHALEAHQRLGSVYTERGEIENYLQRFYTLRSLGALGNENRLDWIERLAAIRDELRLPRLAYTIAARAPDPQMPDPGAGLRFETSRMRLEFGVVHEGDLLRIIERLRTPAMGMFEIRSCALSRVRAGVQGAGPAAPEPGVARGNLAGVCELDWLSMTGTKPPDPAPAQPGNPS